jgi:hypothetical protein
MQSKISDYKFIKGRFASPFNSFGEKILLTDWAGERYPEYIWLALIIKYYGRREGFIHIRDIYRKLIAEFPEVQNSKMSTFLLQPIATQEKIFKLISGIVEDRVLTPLSIILTYDACPIFSKYFYKENISLEERTNRLLETLEEGFPHQTDFATDIRYLALIFSLLKGTMVVPEEIAEKFFLYAELEHDDERMRKIRPTIRAAEQGTHHWPPKNEEFISFFWDKLSSLSECKLCNWAFPNEEPEKNEYCEWLHEIMRYLAKLLVAVKPLDDKMFVLLGLTTFAYKRLSELVEHRLFNTISGRGIIRSLIETYILVKYLLLIEDDHENIWRDFQFYGIGQYKLIMLQGRELGADTSKSHISHELLETLVNEYRSEEFIDIDTSYFDKLNIREKAKKVGESDLYSLMYNYDSAFEHSLWGAVRESSFLKCMTAGHQYHCVPDFDDNQNLKSVWYDSVMVMNKIITIIDTVYGIPDNLIENVNDYERNSFK